MLKKSIVLLISFFLIATSCIACGVKENVLNEEVNTPKVEENVPQNIEKKDEVKIPKIEKEEQKKAVEIMYDYTNYGITTTNVNLRKSPEILENNKVMTYSKGQIVKIIGYVDSGWYKLKVQDKEYYMSKDYIEKTSITKYDKESLQKIRVIGEKNNCYLLEDKTYIDKSSVLDNYPIEKLEFVEIASYQTDYSTSAEGRATNVRLSAETINNKVVMPGEVFSFNNIINGITAEKGYKMATVFSGNKAVQGLGGGVCQVSSTLYNAVLGVNYLEIVERHSHSLPVTYVPKGKDATIATGSLDFRFRNTSEKPIKIVTEANGQTLTIKILESR